MSQSAEVNQLAPGNSGKSFSKLSIGLIVIAVLSLAVAGFTVLNSHVATVTQQQFGGHRADCWQRSTCYC